MPGRRAAVSGRRAAPTSGLRIPTSLPSRAMNERRQAEPDGGRSDLSGARGFPGTVQHVWDDAAIGDVRRELRAQVERAIYWCFDVCHLGSHRSTVARRPASFDVYLELAVYFGPPTRLSGASSERVVGF